MWDAIIAGAGPAGSVAAHVLARNGCRVLLADGVPHKKFKAGEALPGAALRILRELQLPLSNERGLHTQIGGNLSSWGSEELIAADFLHDPDGPGWRLDRLQFDADLRTAALRSGAIFKEVRVLDACRDGKAWSIKFDNDETATARWIVDASGRSAVLSRKLGATWKRDTQLTALYTVGKAGDDIRLNRTIVEAVPEGWWYAALLPSGAAIAGFHTLQERAASLAACPTAWRQALNETRHVAGAFPNLIFDSSLRALDASGGRLLPFGEDGWIACGDAALSFDPIASQGIFSALYSGMMAGKTIHASLTGDTKALDLYTSRLEEVRRIYSLRCLSMYRAEKRWPGSRFWRQVQGVSLLDS
ncbi:MAG TPA: NAD(P)/FAD-dependent oxidoreductase [Candidatus Angelobacter sp.]|nr:NAD(P)/FAD-dependent oxidoreductase [Candidatus Angelobacter sp.]